MVRSAFNLISFIVSSLQKGSWLYLLSLNSKFIFKMQISKNRYTNREFLIVGVIGSSSDDHLGQAIPLLLLAP